MDFLARTIGTLTGTNLPVTVGEKIEAHPDLPSIWDVHEGTRRSDGSKCTVFIFESKNSRMNGAMDLAKNMASKLKKLRIPGVLRIVESVESDTSVVIATEPATPLYLADLDQMSIESKLWGLHTILKTLCLINKEAKCVHGNVNMGSVFITESGEWALGGLELCVSLSTQDSLERSVSMSAELLPGARLRLPPEAQNGGGSSFHKPSPATDSWQFGKLVLQIFNGLNTILEPGIGTRGKVPVTLWNLLRKCMLVESPQQRFPLTKVAANPTALSVFQTDIDNISEALKSLSIATDYQFSEYLETIDRVGDKISDQYMMNSVLPELCKCISMNKGGIKGVSTIIKLSASGKLTEKQYQTYITPLVVQLYASPDRAIRMELLTQLPHYIDKLDEKTVTKQIYPSFAQGFSDTEPAIREQTLKSVELISAKLSERVINGELLRLLAKTQNDNQPEIRANTTILLGKIANRFSASTRSGVLVSAFSKALKDPYVNSRIAALMALSATSEYFTPQECASRLVGALAPSLMDKDKSVRDQALVTMDMFMNIIKKEVYRMDAADNANGDRSATTTPSAFGSDWTNKLWGTMSSKLSADAGQIPERTSSVPLSVGVNSDRSTTSTPVVPEPEPDFDDAWGEELDDELDDFGWGEEEEEVKVPTTAPKLESKPKPQPKPVLQSRSQSAMVSSSRSKETSATAKKTAKPLKLSKPKPKVGLVEPDTIDDSAWGAWD